MVKQETKQRRWGTWLTGILFIVPAVLLFSLFEVFSLIFNIYMGFNVWNGFGPVEFVGIDNYVYLIEDDLFRNAVGHNLIFVAVALVFMTLLALFIALLLDSGVPGANIFRALYFLPVVIPTVVVGLAWTRVYSTQGGLLNQTLEAIGLGALKQDWLGNPQYALMAVIVVWVWRHLGYGIIMFASGLLSIPDDIKEAAELDGASSLQVARYIIIPLLKPIVLIVSVLYTIFAFKVFTLVFIMTGGGPYGATEVMNTYMYENVFRYFDLGLGSAIANIGIVVLIILAIVRSRFSESIEF